MGFIEEDSGMCTFVIKDHIAMRGQPVLVAGQSVNVHRELEHSQVKGPLGCQVLINPLCKRGAVGSVQEQPHADGVACPAASVQSIRGALHSFKSDKRFNGAHDLFRKTSTCLCTPSLLGVLASQRQIIVEEVGPRLNDCGQRLRTTERDELLRHMFNVHGISFRKQCITKKNVHRKRCGQLVLMGIGFSDVSTDASRVEYVASEANKRRHCM